MARGSPLACARGRGTVPAVSTEHVSEAVLDDPSVIRIVIADDHAIVRSGLRMLLDAEPGFDVVAEAGDVEGARRFVRGHHPAVLVLDLNMPGESSLDAIPS